MVAIVKFIIRAAHRVQPTGVSCRVTFPEITIKPQIDYERTFERPGEIAMRTPARTRPGSPNVNRRVSGKRRQREKERKSEIAAWVRTAWPFEMLASFLYLPPRFDRSPLSILRKLSARKVRHARSRIGIKRTRIHEGTSTVVTRTITTQAASQYCQYRGNSRRSTPSASPTLLLGSWVSIPSDVPYFRMSQWCSQSERPSCIRLAAAFAKRCCMPIASQTLGSSM